MFLSFVISLMFGVAFGNRNGDSFLMYSILAVFLGLIPAFIAKGKGRDFTTWHFYGWGLLIFAFPHALMLKETEETEKTEEKKIAEGSMVECPFCAEIIRSKAIVCRYCGRDIVKTPPTAMQNESVKIEQNTPVIPNSNIDTQITITQQSDTSIGVAQILIAIIFITTVILSSYAMLSLK